MNYRQECLTSTALHVYSVSVLLFYHDFQRRCGHVCLFSFPDIVGVRPAGMKQESVSSLETSAVHMSKNVKGKPHLMYCIG